MVFVFVALFITMFVITVQCLSPWQNYGKMVTNIVMKLLE